MDFLLYFSNIVNTIICIVAVATWSPIMGTILAINGTIAVLGWLLVWKVKSKPRDY